MHPTGLRTLFHRDLRTLRKEIEAIREQDLWRNTDGVTNSAGNLCLHICGNLRHFIGHVLGGDDYRRDRPREFNTRGLSKEELLGIVDHTMIAVDQVLGEVSDEACNSPFPGETPVEAKDTCQFLLYLYGHMNYHLGQVNYLRRILAS
ncbi:MAG: DUF1572 family protein [Flavobacteriales bacterium]|nr:DUF1572 family protein [Flavobacteriales bacterium]MEB2342838.1 DUF1572 family protein [Flavobacteriia bacterium]